MSDFYCETPDSGEPVCAGLDRLRMLVAVRDEEARNMSSTINVLRTEILRLQYEVASRNKRALEGDEYKKAFEKEYERAEQLRKANVALMQRNVKLRGLLDDALNGMTSDLDWRLRAKAVLVEHGFGVAQSTVTSIGETTPSS